MAASSSRASPDYPAVEALQRPRPLIVEENNLADEFFIGDLAKQLGMTTKAIRHYEELGLLGAPLRSDAGYRLYVPADVERLRFVQSAKVLGLSLAEIKEIVSIWTAGDAPCSHVSRLLDEKLTDLDRRLKDLTTFRDELRNYKDRIDRDVTSADLPCRHIAGVTEGAWVPSIAEPAQSNLKGKP
jgi:DNA-binding transcriptional MerR regulator